MKIALGYVHPGWVTHEFHESVTRLLRYSPHEITLINKRSGPLIARARNEIVKAFLGTDTSHLWLVDTDVRFEPWQLERLLETGVPIVSALYMGQHEDETVFPVAFVRHDAELRRPESLEGLAEVAAVGMGCCLIRRDVLEAFEPVRPGWPFAEGFWDGEPVGEDTLFCLRAAENGFRSAVLASCRVGHVKSRVI